MASAGYAAGRRLAGLRRQGADVTAVFLANDQMAMGLLAALHEEGLEAPRDVSVVGFDDLPEAPYLTPPLTTVRQDFAELGHRAVELVLARLAGRELHLQPVPPVLLVRSSTGPVPVGRTPAGV
jgi:DNA-binding LacI/PurR family transcriptional regulator